MADPVWAVYAEASDPNGTGIINPPDTHVLGSFIDVQDDADLAEKRVKLRLGPGHPLVGWVATFVIFGGTVRRGRRYVVFPFISSA